MSTGLGHDAVPGDAACEQPDAAVPPAAPDDLAVATVAADTLRAHVVVAGPLAGASVLLLASILRTHLTAGRRYLRVDLTRARAGDPDVVDALVEAHRTVAGLGGMLTFEHATGTLDDALRARGLFVTPDA